jgi:hypothetical protein
MASQLLLRSGPESITGVFGSEMGTVVTILRPLTWNLSLHRWLCFFGIVANEWSRTAGSVGAVC